jgi:6-phosphogluconolactonase
MNTDLRIFEDMQALSAAAADIFVRATAQAIESRGRFLTALSGGSAPTGLYRLLASAPLRDQIDWSRTFVFWGDERCVPPEAEGSNYRQAYENLLAHVPIPGENILRIQGELQPETASDAYTQSLKRYAAPGLDWPRFDLALLGMGADGHTASLFPGSPLEVAAPALPVTADYQGRPAQRITLTPPVFNSARLVVFLVAGENKAAVLKHVLSGILTPEQYPAQRIRPTDGQLIWLVDKAAGSHLPLVE